MEFTIYRDNPGPTEICLLEISRKSRDKLWCKQTYKTFQYGGREEKSFNLGIRKIDKNRSE